MFKIRLIKSTFYEEERTKERLCSFIKSAEKLSMGEECRKFEETFSKFQGRKYSIFVTSGSSANLVLIQSLLNVGYLKKGFRVGVSALTWSTNIMPLIQLGLVPVPIDCELNTLNVSVAELKKKEVDALFLTNALGFCSDIDAIRNYCKEKEILFIEDNCESLGSEYKGTKLGNFGIASTFSFFVGHHLSTIEGGMICTDDETLYKNFLMTRIHGWGRDLPEEEQKKLNELHGISDFYSKYAFYDLAYNARPTEINGFIGNEQMNYIDEIISKREKNFREINNSMLLNEKIIALSLSDVTRISNFGVPFIFKDKDSFDNYLKKFLSKGIEVRPIISGNLDSQPFFKKYFPGEEKSCPNAELIHSQGFYCGNNPEMTPEDIAEIRSLI